MIYAIVMAGGRGTRLKVDVEKPLFKLHDKPLIKYVLDNISSSKLVEDVVIAVSSHTQETTKYLESLNGNFQILNTSGIDYLNDLSYILTLFESKSKNDILLFINADLPFISGETIDFVLTKYLESAKDSLSTQVPVEIFKKLDLEYSYEFNGSVPSGLNVLRSVNEIQEEEQLILPKIELALNINTLKDSIVAEKFYQAFINKTI
ncbi:GTP--adenosylcobinamide-phosphate guanylyltransferase CobY [Methanobrevibacter smithii]|uniref:GTP--adenosylcobinamide-phosphate guanylyltransferase CobY n=1 Tax=Methanobrevibacter smithii TaxID=2173 RepID=UPI00035C1AEB|nr:GTP--adenosylcobinamide-phosphate guanylyltransferase CobY [Methanobrevibacter smithii]